MSIDAVVEDLLRELAPQVLGRLVRVAAAGTPFQLPESSELAERTSAVLHVLYLIFNEGYTASSGSQLQRVELGAEAIRLTRLLHRQTPGDGEISGLLALMLLTDARRDARSGPDGELIPLAEQDRALYDREAIEQATSLLSETLPTGTIGPYQIQAAIAAIHTEARSVEATDWREILALYTLLQRLQPNPMVALNRAVPVAMVNGADRALELLDRLASDDQIGSHHRYHAVRAHVVELSGDPEAARDSYERGAQHAISVPEQRYLRRRGQQLAHDGRVTDGRAARAALADRGQESGTTYEST